MAAADVTTVAGAVLAAAVAAMAVRTWKGVPTLYQDSSAGPDARVQAVTGTRTGLLVGLAGIGAVGALWLNNRTYRLSQQGQFTDRYTKAVDQLGNRQAPVRLGGLHALEWLAQNKPDQQQTIVNVICAYLRMPYTPPDAQPPAEDAPVKAHTRYENRRQELQVQLTAQRILSAHLSPKQVDQFWPDIDLDLSKARLRHLDLTYCHIRNVQFDGAEFGELAMFNGVEFGGFAMFGEAEFGKLALFNGAEFGGLAWFSGAQFGKLPLFNGAQFGGDPVFDGARRGFQRAAHRSAGLRGGSELT